ncbi:MAG: glycosyltransferase [Pirellulaceae bacterium]|nr:glycosyltransferase [Pirellulaceae bacterium]
MRVLLATDQPFWECGGGAQQRIACLWEALRHGLTPTEESPSTLVYYLGDPQGVTASREDIGPVVTVRNESFPATPLPWTWIANWLGAANEREARTPSETKVAPRDGLSSSLTLGDYRWTWVEKHWNATLQRFRPDIVILEYVTMTYLIDLANGPQRERIVWAVDTHDCLSQRAAQFSAAGQKHWLQIDESEEIEALEPADLVIAIQNSERDWFARRLTHPKVIATGHAPRRSGAVADGVTKSTVGELRSDTQVQPRKIRLGFLASNNFPNRHGIENWLREVAPQLRDTSIIIGGSIGTFVAELLNSDDALASVKQVKQAVRCLGQIRDLADFYSEIDVVICPIELGTGLKIKLVEALVFHCPVLASPHATDNGMGFDSGVIICGEPQEWAGQVHNLGASHERLESLRGQAARFALDSLQPEAVYSGLIRELNDLVRQKGSR